MHPIDRLGEIRQQLRKLHHEADAIIARLDAGEIGERGQHYVARHRKQTTVHPLPPAQPAVYQPPGSLYQVQPANAGQQNFGQGAFGIGDD